MAPSRFRGTIACNLTDSLSFHGEANTRAKQLELTLANARNIARKIKARKIPLAIEHNKDHTVGTVTDAFIDGSNNLVCEIEVDDAYTQGLIDSGAWSGLSLSHYREIDEPLEVSLCLGNTGARDGTRLTHDLNSTCDKTGEPRVYPLIQASKVFNEPASPSSVRDTLRLQVIPINVMSSPTSSSSTAAAPVNAAMEYTPMASVTPNMTTAPSLLQKSAVPPQLQAHQFQRKEAAQPQGGEEAESEDMASTQHMSSSAATYATLLKILNKEVQDPQKKQMAMSLFGDIVKEKQESEKLKEEFKAKNAELEAKKLSVDELMKKHRRSAEIAMRRIMDERRRKQNLPPLEDTDSEVADLAVKASRGDFDAVTDDLVDASKIIEEREQKQQEMLAYRPPYAYPVQQQQQQQMSHHSAATTAKPVDASSSSSSSTQKYSRALEIANNEYARIMQIVDSTGRTQGKYQPMIPVEASSAYMYQQREFDIETVAGVWGNIAGTEAFEIMQRYCSDTMFRNKVEGSSVRDTSQEKRYRVGQRDESTGFAPSRNMYLGHNLPQ